MDPHGRRAVELERPEVGARRVVHLDRAAEVARAGGAEDRLELAAARAALEPAGDEDRVLLGGHPEPLELVDHGGDRLLARVDRGAREGQRARLDDDRDPAAARGEIGERRAGERIAERLADRGRDVAQRIERRRRHQQHARRRRSRRAAPASRRGEGCVPPPSGSGAALGDRAEEAEERRAVPELRPGARRQQVRRPPVGDDHRRSPRLPPSRARSCRAPGRRPAPRASGRTAAKPRNPALSGRASPLCMLGDRRSSSRSPSRRPARRRRRRRWRTSGRRSPPPTRRSPPRAAAGRAREDGRRMLVRRQRELELGETGISSRVGRRISSPSGSSVSGVSGASRIAWTCCCPKPSRNQASMSAAIAGGGDRVVRRAPLLDPAGRRERVEVAHVLGDRHGVAGGLDPDVRPPGRVLARRPEQVADDLAAARGDGARGVLRRELLDRLARHVELLVGGRQARARRRAGRHGAARAGALRRRGTPGRTDGSRGASSGRTVPPVPHPRGRSCIDSPHVPEDDHGCRARARRRPCARRRAVPRRRQQPRLPRVLRAPRGARDERRDADERAARVREHALQAPRRLQAARRRRRLGHAPGAPRRGRRGSRRRLQGRAASRCPTSCASSSRTSGRSSRRSATGTSSSRAGRPTT